jgi:putative ABC transport system permease protein
MRINEISESVKLAFDSMRVNKMRSLLATLGVVIGISFVIIMGWVLAGLDSVLESTINIIGTDMLYIDKWDWAGGKRWQDIMNRKPITVKQANDLISRLRTPELALPVARKFNANLECAGESLQNINVIGTYYRYGMLPAGDVTEGRFFNQIEDQYAANTVVVGYTVYKALFPEGGGIGKTIKINGKGFQIIGVVKKQGTILLDFVDQQVFIPLNSFFGIFGRNPKSLSIALKAGNDKYLEEVKAEAIGVMREIRNLKPWEEEDFSVNETKAFEKSSETFRLYVWGIGIGFTILSFIVGIIGIMNIMFVSVAERTKEIGIRKAIGAPKRSILFQFITESAALCFFGAIVAFIGCSILIFLTATFLPKVWPQVTFLSPTIPYQLLFIATVVSVVVGVLAGLIPAVRAARLDPVDALRFE